MSSFPTVKKPAIFSYRDPSIVLREVMMGEIWGRSERWIKHYSSAHNILLVGEGDFSFSSCLAGAFDSAANIVATSKDSFDELMCKYQNAFTNVWTLRTMGAIVLHGVDATEMKALPDLRWKKFHRIIYNFPHAGFHGKEDNPTLIKKHVDLVRGFLQNARSMLEFDGEVHINHKTTAPFDSWKIEDLGLECSLLCIGQDEFKIEDYPGYCNKRGSGWRPDDPFPLGPCKTFKFKLRPAPEQIPLRKLALMPPSSHQMRHPAPAVHPLSYDDVNSSISGRALHYYTSDVCRVKPGVNIVRVEESFGSSSTDDVYRCIEESIWVRSRYKKMKQLQESLWRH